MLDILHFEFMQNALVAGLIASVICGVIGSLVVVNRVVFLSGGVAHAAYGGVGLAFFLGLPVLPTAAGFAVCAALIMAWVTLRAKDRADTIIGVLWAAGMATGVILTDLAPGYNVDLMSWLFGSILAVPRQELWTMAALACLILAVTLLFHRGFLAMSFDEEFARTRGVPTRFLHFLLMAMIALCVVLVVQVVGLILVIALLTVPPYMAERKAHSLGGMMLISAMLSAVFCMAGLWLSYALNVTSGATIIAVACAAFFLFLAIDRKKRPRKHPASALPRPNL